MRKTLLFVPLILAALLACDESFDPQGEFTERPVLYCVMSPSILGPVSPRAVLTRTVPGRSLLEGVDGFSSPVVRGAEITLQTGRGQYLFAEILDTLNAGTPEQLIQLTYGHSSVFLRPTDATSIRAVLPDGRILTASTYVPPSLYFELSYEFPHGFTTAINPLTRGSTWTFSWEAPDGCLHFPELLLSYTVVRTDSTTSSRSVRIPQRILLEGGKESPAYPQATFERSCGFDYAAIDSVFARLARDEGEVLQIGIDFLQFSVITYDVPLARFYTSAHGSMDPYSVRVDETVYTNIDGGIGVFGTYVASTLEYAVDRAYVASFGYVNNY